MPESVLVNARIDQLPVNAQLKGTYLLAVRNTDTNVTEQVLVSEFITANSSNFEWVSDTTYAEDEVVTRQGLWYQALRETTNDVPGESVDDWVEISKGSSGLTLHTNGVYPQNEVYVLKEISGVVYLFKLADAVTRPFVSSDFEAELLAGSWEHIGAISTEILDASAGTVTIDFLGLIELAFVMSEVFDEPKTFAFDKEDNAEHIKALLFEIDGLHVITFPSDVEMSDPRWDSSAYTWTPYDTGKYKLTAVYDTVDSVWIMDINGPYT